MRRLLAQNESLILISTHTHKRILHGNHGHIWSPQALLHCSFEFIWHNHRIVYNCWCCFLRLDFQAFVLISQVGWFKSLRAKHWDLHPVRWPSSTSHHGPRAGSHGKPEATAGRGGWAAGLLESAAGGVQGDWLVIFTDKADTYRNL